MPTQHDPPAKTRSKAWRGLLLPVVVFLSSAVYFGWRLPDEAFFMDESATLAHTYYYRLLKEGRFQDVDWLHQASYDHLQVGRILAGLALDLDDSEVPKTIEPMENWWRDATSTGIKPPADMGPLIAARWPMMIGAAFGCAMMYLVGRAFVGPFTGLLATALLATSPLYVRHARLALADDWVQAFILAGVAAWIAMSRRCDESPFRFAPWLGLSIMAGSAFGFAAQTKLNGGVGLVAAIVVVVFSSLLAALVSRLRPSSPILGKWIAGSAIAAIVACAVFLGIHPYFYAQPDLVHQSQRSAEWIEEEIQPLASQSAVGRFRHMLAHRADTLDAMLEENRFPEDSLPNVLSRLSAIVREGMGRWSAASRLGWSREIAAIPTAGLTGLGTLWCILNGWRRLREGRLPYAWVIVAWALVEMLMLLRGLTLDWDRYYMGVVTWSSLLVALGVGGTLTTIGRKLILPPPSESGPAPRSGEK